MIIVMEHLSEIIQGLSTAIPIVVTCLIVLYKFKNELCKRMDKMEVEIHTHINISESDRSEFEKVRERLTNVILKNKLKV